MNTLSVAVFAVVVAVASAGLLGAPLVQQGVYAQQVAVPAATYSNYGARISQSARPVAYAQQIAAPVAYAQQIAAPVAYSAPAYASYASPSYAVAQPVAYAQQVVPAATYSTFKNRVSQSARPVAYAAAVPQVAYAQQAIAAPALGYGYNGAIASTLLH